MGNTAKHDNLTSSSEELGGFFRVSDQLLNLLLQYISANSKQTEDLHKVQNFGESRQELKTRTNDALEEFKKAAAEQLALHRKPYTVVEPSARRARYADKAPTTHIPGTVVLCRNGVAIGNGYIVI